MGFSGFSCLTALLLVFLTPCRGGDLRVSAAASLSLVLTEINSSFEKETGTRIRLNSGASGTLARQILAGAPADIFFSADTASLDSLESQQRLLAGTRTDLLSNTLVIIAPADSPLHFEKVSDLTQPAVRRLALGNPLTVPAGTYARELLTKAGLWNTLEPRIVRMENVRAALAVVESGDADAGIVFRTDAASTSRVKVLLRIPAADGPRIRYSAAILADSAVPDSARAWLRHLARADSRAAFERAGFIVLSPTVPSPAAPSPAAPSPP